MPMCACVFIKTGNPTTPQKKSKKKTIIDEKLK